MCRKEMSRVDPLFFRRGARYAGKKANRKCQSLSKKMTRENFPSVPRPMKICVKEMKESNIFSLFSEMLYFTKILEHIKSLPYLS